MNSVRSSRCVHRASMLILAVLIYGIFAEPPGYRVKGRYLYDHCGEKVILRGVNRMEIWAGGTGESFPEIAKTGANCLRIVWTTEGSVSNLDNVITKCIQNKMIPMVELHDATGKWSELSKMVDWWVKSDVVQLIRKHEKYLLVNIANECGDTSVTASQWVNDYGDGIKRMRQANIDACLVVDATHWGRYIAVIISSGQKLLDLDPQKNILFSAHAYWPQNLGWSDQLAKDTLQAAVDKNIPFIIGEFGNKWDLTPSGAIPYKTILAECQRLEIGWLAWSWGPGNQPQTWLDMTSNSTYAGLHDWGLEVAVTDPNSIKNTSVRPYFIVHGECNKISVNHQLHENTYSYSAISPRSNGSFTLTTSGRIDGVLELLDIKGRSVVRMGSAIYGPGTHHLAFDTRRLSSGTYFFRIVNRDSHVNRFRPIKIMLCRF